jgi:hypothetical protein
MDLASTCAALLNWLGWGQRPADDRVETAPEETGKTCGTPRRARRVSVQDPAEMGTAYGLEESLTPIFSEYPSGDPVASTAAFDSTGWLRPR